ncbi:cysteinyl-tRNA synthetase, mitochondrial-like protein [Camelus ferus]|nr:cysteinyl-tRNA synthetase, mitochondrial-like protein [Camelus ferus]
MVQQRTDKDIPWEMPRPITGGREFFAVSDPVRSHGPSLLTSLPALPGACAPLSVDGRAGSLAPAGYDTGVKVYNSLTRRKDPLIVSNVDAVSWYSCGPSVYDHAHLGHACSSYVRFDIIRRILSRVFGCNIIMVMGVTDVDDKIIKRANEAQACAWLCVNTVQSLIRFGLCPVSTSLACVWCPWGLCPASLPPKMNVSPASLANLYEEDFKQDMAALKVLPPTVYLRVTDNIPQIIAFIEGVIARGHAYCTAKGNVYFDLQSRGDKYGRLVGVAPGPVGEPAVDSDKRHPSDFALWKAVKPQEPAWASPWGNGRPGWHIECSTICSLVFGSHLDIHSGGIDLAFPHHENEIAQCEAFHQCRQWGNYFLHAAAVGLGSNGPSAVPALTRVSVSTHGRSRCLNAGTGKGFAAGLCSDFHSPLGRTKGAVQEALADDFNTPGAVDAVMGLVHHGNRQLKAASEEPGGPRSPAVFGAIVSYVEQFFETVGVSLVDRQGLEEGRHPQPPSPLGRPVFGAVVSYVEQFFEMVGVSLVDRQCAAGAGGLAALHSVVEELVRFRLKVRQFALATGEASGEARRQQLLERRPLLEACDALRRDLAAHGVSIKVSRCPSRAIRLHQSHNPDALLCRAACEQPGQARQLFPSGAGPRKHRMGRRPVTRTRLSPPGLSSSPGQEQHVHVGATGPEDRRPQTRELRTREAQSALSPDKSFILKFPVVAV